ncbi:hypothetical protein A2Z67_05730 [Candidatus Woesebacteria bacterium RBG_13_36_22]|uniref:Haloacid dehalogenase n=1 Tax=Candidatus Woesebacteria bacterium RBG_13_36_22 TaxID=1802478 RepID=A0A1F7X1Y4_9BACT|nr:MAG: hypothetical protein A2Z67_05730 [Candidatus Woesebacteria bacterium RBG_13_36_22]
MVGLIFDLDDTLYDSKQFVFAGFEEICKKISVEMLKNFYDIDPNKVMHRFGNSIYRGIKPKLTLYPWVNPLFKILTCPVGLITNGDKEIQNNKIDVLGIHKYFDHIIILDDPKFYKPNPSSLQIMSDVLKVDKVCYVGDRESDKKFAENADAYFIDVKEDKFIERIMYCCPPGR